MVRHWLRHTPTYRSFDLRSTQSALTSSILMRFFPSHPTPFGYLYIRYNLLDLIDRISYTIKTKFLNFFIPTLLIIKIATIWRMKRARKALIPCPNHQNFPLWAPKPHFLCPFSPGSNPEYTNPSSLLRSLCLGMELSDTPLNPPGYLLRMIYQELSMIHLVEYLYPD